MLRLSFVLLLLCASMVTTIDGNSSTATSLDPTEVGATEEPLVLTNAIENRNIAKPRLSLLVNRLISVKKQNENRDNNSRSDGNSSTATSLDPTEAGATQEPLLLTNTTEKINAADPKELSLLENILTAIKKLNEKTPNNSIAIPKINAADPKQLSLLENILTALKKLNEKTQKNFIAIRKINAGDPNVLSLLENIVTALKKLDEKTQKNSKELIHAVKWTSPCPSPWRRFAHMCLLPYRGLATWPFANQYCASNGGYLLWTENASERERANAFALKEVSDGWAYFIGLHRQSKDAPVQWAGGSKSSYHGRPVINGHGMVFAAWPHDYGIYGYNIKERRPFLCRRHI